jgi:hypothetical protein
MCWRNDVQWAIHTSDDPKKFMTVTSGEYVLAIPDYSHQARTLPEHHQQRETDSVSSAGSKNAAVFKKVIMKLSGNVQWLAGLVFERDLESGKRSSNFEPHYGVVLKNPKHMEKWQLEVRQTLFFVVGANEDRITMLFVDSEVITSIFR